MINIRFHIISLVAVFLALGVGVALGSAFIDTAVVGQLEQNIDTLSTQKNELQAESSLMQAQLDAVERLGEEAGAELLGGQLDGVPAYMIGVRGIDEDPVDLTADALVDGDAEFGGTLWLTERLALSDETERLDLARVLGLEPSVADDPDALRDALLLRLGNALADALRAEDPLATDPPDGGGEGETGETGEGGAGPTGLEPEEPAIITELRTAGFVEFEAAGGESSDTGMLLPTAGARMVVVSGQGAAVPDDEIVLPLLRRLTVAGPVAVVAAQSLPPDPPDGEEPSRTSFIGVIRNDDELRASLSTVDDIELFIGRVATVLALRHAADDIVGHYGLGDGADQVAPTGPEDE
ncbi:MAG: copper transporter [Acidimicrobiales bacterium]